MNELQKEQTADQHGDGNPKMNVGEHDRHPISSFFTYNVSFHHLFLGRKNMINATIRQRKSKGSAEGADVRGDFVEGALGTGDDFIGAKAFEDFGEFVEIAADHDGGFLVALAGALGD